MAQSAFYLKLLDMIQDFKKLTHDRFSNSDEGRKAELFRLANQLEVLENDFRERERAEIPPSLSESEHEVICRLMFEMACSGEDPVFASLDGSRHDMNPSSEEMPEGRSPAPTEGGGPPDDSGVMYVTLVTERMLDYDNLCFEMLGERRKSDDSSIYARGGRMSGSIMYRPYYFFMILDEVDASSAFERERTEAQHSAEKGNSPNPSARSAPDNFMSGEWVECRLGVTLVENDPAAAEIANSETSLSHSPSDSPLSLWGIVVTAASPVQRRGFYLTLNKGEVDSKIFSLIEMYGKRAPEASPQRVIEDTIREALSQAFSFETVSVYNVGNANCIKVSYLRGSNSESCCFLNDIGVDRRTKPEVLFASAKRTGNASFVDIAGRLSPTMVVLSHWHMDHILGSAYAGYDIFDCPWIGPELSDYKGRVNVIRIARYLRLKGRLRLVGRNLLGKLVCHYSCPSAEFSLWRGDSGKGGLSAVNGNGLAISITTATGKGALTSTVLPGDVEYHCLPKAAMKKVDDCTFLVVPHHCRKPGKTHPRAAAISAAPKDRYAVICTIDSEDELIDIRAGLIVEGGEITNQEHLLLLDAAGFIVQTAAESPCGVEFDLNRPSLPVAF